MESVETTIQNYEKEVCAKMMEVISSAKDCTPGTKLYLFKLYLAFIALFDYPDQQQSIVDACRVAAKNVFTFKDVVKSMLLLLR